MRSLLCRALVTACVVLSLLSITTPATAQSETIELDRYGMPAVFKFSGAHEVLQATVSGDGSTTVAFARLEPDDPVFIISFDLDGGAYDFTVLPAFWVLTPTITPNMISRDGAYIALLTDQGVVRLDVENNTFEIVEPGQDIVTTSISGDGQQVVSTKTDGVAYRVDLTTGFRHAVGGSDTYIDHFDRIVSPQWDEEGRVSVHRWNQQPEDQSARWFYSQSDLCAEQLIICNDGVVDAVFAANMRAEPSELVRVIYYHALRNYASSTGLVAFIEDNDVVVRDGSAIAGHLNATDLEELTASADYFGEQAHVLRLYQAYFDREPDIDGVQYWLRLLAQGHPAENIAEWMSLQPEFSNIYEGTSNAVYVAGIYNNVLGRNFDQAGYDYWLGLLDDGQLSRSGVVHWIAQNQEFINNYPFR